MRLMAVVVVTLLGACAPHQIDFCDLDRGAWVYLGQSVRLSSAVLFGAHETTMRDPKCPELFVEWAETDGYSRSILSAQLSDTIQRIRTEDILSPTNLESRDVRVEVTARLGWRSGFALFVEAVHSAEPAEAVYREPWQRDLVRCLYGAPTDAPFEQIARHCNVAAEHGAFQERADFLLIRNRPADALADYDRALARMTIEPNNLNIPEVLYGRGVARLMLGQVEEGQIDVARARLIDGVAGYRITLMRERNPEIGRVLAEHVPSSMRD